MDSLTSSAEAPMPVPPAPIPANDFTAQWAVVQEDVVAAMRRVGASGWYVLGREVAAFERALAHAWPVPQVVGCGNGLDALEIALRALELPPGTPVLTTPLSAFATTLAILRAGGVPWFVDVDVSGLIDLSAAEEAFADHPELRWFVPVHLYGQALDARRLAGLIERFGLRVIEDCAQSIGARSRGEPTGRAGLAAATSFYPTKNLGCLGDGGAFLTDSPALAARARALRDYGQSAKYEHAERGLNSRLDELQAAILKDAFLPRLGEWNERRRALAARYRMGIGGGSVRVPPAPDGSDSCAHLFPVLVEEPSDFLRHLAEHGITAGRHYPIAIPDQPALCGVAQRVLGSLPRARGFAAREVSLPIHPFLSDAAAARVLAACRDYAPGEAAERP
jgi:dTDP-3-amino-3,4,6-trideoxy-alpha-D-glucose transaminase